MSTIMKSSVMNMKVSAVIMHEEFESSKGGPDIALLRMEKPFRFGRKVSPICLATKDIAEGQMCIAAGWGKTHEKKMIKSVVIQEVSLPTISRSDCRTKYYKPEEIHAYEFCAGYSEGGKDACQGDSGGPFMCKVNKVYNLQGVVSWGEGCGRANKPGVYTRVAYKPVHSWITNKTADYKRPPSTTKTPPKHFDRHGSSSPSEQGPSSPSEQGPSSHGDQGPASQREQGPSSNRTHKKTHKKKGGGRSAHKKSHHRHGLHRSSNGDEDNIFDKGSRCNSESYKLLSVLIIVTWLIIWE